MKKSLALLLPLALFGCAGQKIILENKAGEQVTCAVSTGSAMLTGAALRNAKMSKCKRQYEEQGYTKVVEAK